MFGPFNMIHGSAESAPQLGRECDVTGQRDMMHDCDLIEYDYSTLLHTMSHIILTCGMVTTM